MAFTVKDWKDSPDATTPLSAAALEDVEDRLSDYADAVAAAGSELGYAEITASAARASTTYADVAGLSATVTVAARPIAVYFSCANAVNGNANAGVGVKILEDGTAIGFAQTFFTAANVSVPMHRRLRRAPSAGDHTYKVQLAAIFSGTATLNADTNTAYGPCAISIVEI